MKEIKKIQYIANVRLPTEKAHGLQIMDMLTAFNSAGLQVELIVPNRDNPIKEDLFNYYGKNSLPVKRLWCWDLISRARWLGSIAFLVESLTFAWSIKKYTRQSLKGTIVYTRDLLPLFFLSGRTLLDGGVTIVYEAHSLPSNPGWVYKRLLSRVSKIVSITNGLKKDLVVLGFPENYILVAPDGVDLNLFQVKDNPQVCRTKLGLPQDRTIVMYTGHLYTWKGVDTVLEAAEKLPELLFVFVGGTEQDKESFIKKVQDKKLDNVIVCGQVSQTLIPDYLGAANLLVLPNSAHTKISALYTSPLKLFEYMASGRPIVASQLPSIQEILTEESATFFTPDDPVSLVTAISEIITNKTRVQSKVEYAKKKVTEYTWSARVRAILTFLRT